MTVEEIFQKVAKHMVEGLMVHNDMFQEYLFLKLDKFAREHEKRYVEENESYRALINYYTSRYHKLLDIGQVGPAKIIPETWYKYTSYNVDVNTKRQAIKDLLSKWVNWEKETKKLYEEMYYELTNLRESAAANFINKYVKDVDKELAYAEAEYIKYETIGYDIATIIDWQTGGGKK